MINSFKLKVKNASIWRYYKDKGLIVHNVKDVTEAVKNEDLEVKDCSNINNLATLLYCIDRYEGVEVEFEENFKLTIFPDTMTLSNLYNVKFAGFPEIFLSLKDNDDDERFLYAYRDNVYYLVKELSNHTYIDKPLIDNIEYIRTTKYISNYNDLTYSLPVFENDIFESLIEMIRYVTKGKKLIYSSIQKDEELYQKLFYLINKEFMTFNVSYSNVKEFNTVKEFSNRLFILPRNESSFKVFRETWNELMLIIHDTFQNPDSPDILRISTIMKSRLLLL